MGNRKVCKWWQFHKWEIVREEVLKYFMSTSYIDLVDSGYKVCTKCGELKTINEFNQAGILLTEEEKNILREKIEYKHTMFEIFPVIPYKEPEKNFKHKPQKTTSDVKKQLLDECMKSMHNFKGNIKQKPYIKYKVTYGPRGYRKVDKTYNIDKLNTGAE